MRASVEGLHYKVALFPDLGPDGEGDNVQCQYQDKHKCQPLRVQYPVNQEEGLRINSKRGDSMEVEHSFHIGTIGTIYWNNSLEFHWNWHNWDTCFILRKAVMP